MAGSRKSNKRCEIFQQDFFGQILSAWVIMVGSLETIIKWSSDIQDLLSIYRYIPLMLYLKMISSVEETTAACLSFQQMFVLCES